MNSSKKILAIGELLLRFSPKQNGDWTTKQQMQVHIGGAELNVAKALGLWGLPVKYFTALPNNFISEQIINQLQKNKIDTTAIQFSGNRIGTYYVPQDADLKTNQVVYDRNYSSFSEIKTGEINWEYVLQDCTWLHLTAIVPSLNQQLANVCIEVLEAATKRGCTISIDLNYRKQLWQYGKQPNEIMGQLAQYAHVIMGNIWAAETMLGIPQNNTEKNIHQIKNCTQQATQTAQQVFAMFRNCQFLANTFRFTDNEKVDYFTTLNSKTEQVVSAIYSGNNVVSRIGSGDCFMAGLIYGMINKNTNQQIIDFATAAAFQKLYIDGDATTNTIDEINEYLKNYAK